MKRAIKVFAVIVFAIWVLSRQHLQLETPVTLSDEKAASSEHSNQVASTAASICNLGQPASGNVVAVVNSFEPRTTPSNSGDRIKNQKASSILGSIKYHEIDPSTTVKQLCMEGAWSEVQIVTPEWLTFVRGWVPSNVLREIERTGGGIRVYVETDFIWDDDTSKFKSQIVAITNKIAQEHTGCSDLDTGSVSMSPSRSKPGDPVFFITCNPSGMPFNVWFRPGDAGKTFLRK